MAIVDCKVYNRFGVPGPFHRLILGVFKCDERFS